ncbi:hypothetical protein B0H16DRAFT_442210 [Mycena metata]|uniref:Secreted protein n=1 Tax=Mycena metata TaxID=1033252 RepID=A0AAD7JGE5_9AGAR|nr:hypothetical protein B0H16DRAFT_442210 [Mycena metata]
MDLLCCGWPLALLIGTQATERYPLTYRTTNKQLENFSSFNTFQCHSFTFQPRTFHAWSLDTAEKSSPAFPYRPGGP